MADRYEMWMDGNHLSTHKSAGAAERRARMVGAHAAMTKLADGGAQPVAQVRVVRVGTKSRAVVVLDFEILTDDSGIRVQTTRRDWRKF